MGAEQQAMKLLVQLCLLLGLGVAAMAAAAGPSAAQGTSDGIPDCINSDTNGTRPADGLAWWNRRSEEHKKYIRELPCQERYIPMVCIFLWEPDLRGCTNKGVADYRASKFCDEQGFALLTEEHEACKAQYKKSFVPPFPGPTS